MIKLHELICSKGSHKRKKRVGCGKGSGHGKTSTRGEKGQGARSGGPKKVGFEGGQMPLYRLIPKRGFNNTRFGHRYTIVNLGQLNSIESPTISPAILLEKNIIKTIHKNGIKILGHGELTRSLNISAHAFTQAAKEKIEKSGGSWKELRERV